MPADKLHITLAGREHVVEAGTTAAAVLEAEPAIAARINGELRDLAAPLTDGDEVEPVAADSPDGLAIIRHSTAHVLAQAVQELFPAREARHRPADRERLLLRLRRRRSRSPPTTSRRIEKRMHQIVKQGQRFPRRAVTDDEARAELADEPYKLELIGLKGSGPRAAAGRELPRRTSRQRRPRAAPRSAPRRRSRSAAAS